VLHVSAVHKKWTEESVNLFTRAIIMECLIAWQLGGALSPL